MRLNLNKLILWTSLIGITLLALVCGGCSSSLKEENQRLTLTAIRILMEKNHTIDSLEVELDDCKNTKLLRVKK